MRKVFLLMALFCVVAMSAMAQNDDKKQKGYDLVTEGVELFDKGKMAEAIKKYDAAMKYDDTYASTYYEKALALYNLGKAKEAKKVLEKSLKKCTWGNVAMNYKLLADLIDEEGDSRKAIEYYTKAFDVPGDLNRTMKHSLYYNVGVAFSRLSDQEPDSMDVHINRAMNCFYQALTHNPKHPGSYYAFANMVTHHKGKPSQWGYSWALGMLGWYGFFGGGHPMINKLVEMPDKWAAIDLTQEELDSLGPRTRKAYESVREAAKKEPSEYGQLYDVFMYAIPKVAEGYTDEPVPLCIVDGDFHDPFLWSLYAKIVREGMLETFCHAVAVRDEKHYITNANWLTKNDEAIKKFLAMLNEGRYFDPDVREEQEFGLVPPVDSVASADEAHALNKEANLACRYYLKHYIGTEEMDKTCRFLLSWSTASPDVTIPIGEGEERWFNEQSAPYLMAYVAACSLYQLEEKTEEMDEDAYCTAVSTVVWYYANNKDKTGTNDELERLLNLYNNDPEAFYNDVKSRYPVAAKEE